MGGRGASSRSGGTSPQRVFVSSSAFPTQCTTGQCLPLHNETLAEFFLTTAEGKNKLLSLRTAPSLGLYFEEVEKFEVLSLSMMEHAFSYVFNYCCKDFEEARKWAARAVGGISISSHLHT